PTRASLDRKHPAANAARKFLLCSRPTTPARRYRNCRPGIRAKCRGPEALLAQLEEAFRAPARGSYGWERRSALLGFRVARRKAQLRNRPDRLPRPPTQFALARRPPLAQERSILFIAATRRSSICCQRR